MDFDSNWKNKNIVQFVETARQTQGMLGSVYQCGACIFTRVSPLTQTRSLISTAWNQMPDLAQGTNSTTPFVPSSTLSGKKARKLNKEQVKKQRLKALIEKKRQFREPYNMDPMYMDIPSALRLLRAIEVGQPHTSQTITLTTRLFNDRGTQPLSGEVLLATPLKTPQVVAFSGNPEALEELQGLCFLSGGAELVDEIAQGKSIGPVDKVFATPDIAGYVQQKLGKLWGRKGLIPTVKRGRVSDNLKQLIKDDSGRLPFKQRGSGFYPYLCMNVGTCSMTDEQILRNILCCRTGVLEALQVQKANAAKRQHVSIFGRTFLSTARSSRILVDFI